MPSDLPDSTPGPSAMSSMTSTPSESYNSDSETASIPLPSGMTSTPSIPNPGEDTSISLAPGSPANPTPKPEPVGSPKDLTMIETFGPKHESAFGYWDASTSCLRTYQASFLEMMDGRAMGSVYLGTFPHWGLMQDGEFIAQPMPVPATCAAAGLSWPTPRAGKTTDEEEESWRARYEDGKVNTPPLGLAVKMHHIPTPTTADVYTGNMKSSQQSDGSMHSVSLPDYVEMFPTPSTMDHIERKGMRPSRAATNRTTGYLSEEVVRWATPTGEDAKNTAGPGREKRHGPMLNLQVTQDPESIEGSLNPDWVEQHLMSLPEGWTRLEPVPDGAYDEGFDAMRDGTWWDTERGLPRVTTGAENRVNRLKMLGNGIVPATLALFLIDD